MTDPTFALFSASLFSGLVLVALGATVWELAAPLHGHERFTLAGVAARSPAYGMLLVYEAVALLRFRPLAASCRRTNLARMEAGMSYELWDLDTGNATGVYPSLIAALQVVEAAVRREGEPTLEGLALLERRADGDRRLIGQERDLLPMIGAGTSRTR